MRGGGVEGNFVAAIFHRRIDPTKVVRAVDPDCGRYFHQGLKRAHCRCGEQISLVEHEVAVCAEGHGLGFQGQAGKQVSSIFTGGDFLDPCISLGAAALRFHGIRQHRGQGRLPSAVSAIKDDAVAAICWKRHLAADQIQHQIACCIAGENNFRGCFWGVVRYCHKWLLCCV